eukprot:XP_001697799.1 predicted protein [Chlamydomonas reinhardtii]
MNVNNELRADCDTLKALGAPSMATLSQTKPRHGPPTVKPPEPAANTSVKKPWQLRNRNRQAVTEWTWQDKSDFWAALGRAPKDPACLPPLTAHKGFFVAFRAQARAALKMVRKFPSVLVLPLLVLALLVGLGIFGVDAEAAALKAANAYSLSLDAAILPVLTLGTFIRETPAMAALGPAFPRIAADLLKQARNSAALQLKLVPFGIVRAIVPPILDLGTLGLNLFTDPTRRQEALQTVELKSVWMAGPLAVPPEERPVLIARNPVFIACYDETTKTKFWGFAAVYIAFDNLTTGPNSPLLPLRNRNYLYRLTKPAAGESGQAVILSESSPAPPGGSEAVAVPVYLPGIPWLLEVYPEGDLTSLSAAHHHTLRMGRPFYDFFPAVTVLDCSVVRYYSAVVKMLNDVYKSLDAIAERHGLHKVETYNDSYVCVGGCPEADGKILNTSILTHAAAAPCTRASKYRSAGGQRLQLQIGLHSGPVSAAVIDGGKRLPRYCIFGGTVATATQLRTTSAPQAIHVSRATAELLAEAGSKAAAPAALPVAAMPSLPAPAPVTPTVSGFDEHASVLSALNGYSLAAAVRSGTESDRSSRARNRLQEGVRAQMARNRGFHVMSTFIKSLETQLADVEPYTGRYGSPERLAERLRRTAVAAVEANPAGYREDVAAAEVALYRQVSLLHFCRPYFLAPGPVKEAVPLRPASSHRLLRRSATASLAARTMESVFLPRATDNDAGDLLDTNSVRERQARKDWNRVVRKDGFKSMIARDDPAVRGGLCGMGGALDACLAVLLRHKDSIKSAFGFYGIQGTETTEQCFAIGHNEWRAFVTDCGLAADAAFLAANYKPDKQSAEGQANLDRALMRFEFIEALIRLAVARHAAFDLYRASNKDKRLRLADWLGLVNAAGLIGEATGLSQRDARICFARSLCVVVDEVAAALRDVLQPDSINGIVGGAGLQQPPTSNRQISVAGSGGRRTLDGIASVIDGSRPGTIDGVSGRGRDVVDTRTLRAAWVKPGNDMCGIGTARGYMSYIWTGG